MKQGKYILIDDIISLCEYCAVLKTKIITKEKLERINQNMKK